MSDPTYTALREYRRRVAAMLADPDCTRELFSLGVSLLDYAVLRTDTDKSWAHYAERVWGEQSYSRYEIRHVLKKDIRRYDAIEDAEKSSPGRRCGAPMIRRQGPCGNSASRQAMLTDAATGRKQWLAGCARHREWFETEVRRNRAVVTEAAAVVIPAANAGGVLERHIPEIDWRATWLKLDPSWVPPPESAPEEVPLKPKLTLVLGGAS